VSTSDIRALIKRTKEKALEIRASSVWWPDAGLMADKALIQLEAIERAAKVVQKDRDGEYVMGGELESAWELLESIAKDAK
jgi:hypothetical protein